MVANGGKDDSVLKRFQGRWGFMGGTLESMLGSEGK